MDERLRELVRNRAGLRCESCRLRQEHMGMWRHHVEHVIPVKHGGPDEPSNLALACVRCNLSKSSNLSGIDSVSGTIVPLFHPRQQRWSEHSSWRGAEIFGKTAVGRATVAVLNMNEPQRLRIELNENGELD